MNLSSATDAICDWDSLYKDKYLSTLTGWIIDPGSWTTIRNCHDDKVWPEFKDNEFDGNDTFYIIFSKKKKGKLKGIESCLIAKQPHKFIRQVEEYLSVEPGNMEPTLKDITGYVK